MALASIRDAEWPGVHPFNTPEPRFLTDEGLAGHVLTLTFLKKPEPLFTDSSSSTKSTDLNSTARAPS